MYADDTTLFCNFNDSNITEETLNEELKKLTRWLNANQLSLNVGKTKFMCFTQHAKWFDIQCWLLILKLG